MRTCCSPDTTTTRRSRDSRIAVAVGAASALVSIAGSWVPSFWGDEAASIMSARREWASLFALLAEVDAVHGLYYALLHPWIDIAGTSPFAVRLPSGLAIGAASAGLYLLVRRRADSTLALIAAILFTAIPRVSQVSIDARSMALATAVGVWMTLLLLHLLDGTARRGWWVVYAVGLAVGTYLFLHLALLVPAHAVVVAHHLAGARRTGSPAQPDIEASARRFVLAWLTAAALAAPVGVLAVRQREQIAFREREDVVNAESMLVTAWFILPATATAAWSLVAVAVGAAVIHRRDPAWSGIRQLFVLSTAWVLVPAVTLVSITMIFTPVFTPRYLVLSAPAIAIVMAVGVIALPRRWMRGVAIAVVVGLAVPADVGLRTPYSKNFGTDWQDVAAAVGQLACPGDGIVFDEHVRPSRRPRLAMHTYPDGFRGLVDLTLVRPYHRTDGLWDVTAPLSAVAERLDAVDRVIVVSRSESGTDDDVAVLRREGFALVERRMLVTDEVAVYERPVARNDEGAGPCGPAPVEEG